MAKFRQLHTSFWDDPLILDLTPEQKYFYIYLLTNPNVLQCGIYEIALRQIVYHTGYNKDTIMQLIQMFESMGKIVYSKETNEIAIVNFLKYNYSKSPSVKKCIEKDLESVKNKDLIKFIYCVGSVGIECIDNKEEEEEEEEKEKKKNKKSAAGVDYYNNITMPNYYDIHYAKRIERDDEMVKKYRNHLISLGYECVSSYNGEQKWRMKKK
jgi:hypothetical protein